MTSTRETDADQTGTETEQGNPDCDLPMCVGSPDSDTKVARDDEGHGDLIDVCEDCLNSGIAGFVEVVGDGVATDGGEKVEDNSDDFDMSRFDVEVTDETTLSKRDTVEHADHGPMSVEQVSIGPTYKRIRLQSQIREDGLSIELTEDELRDAWGEKIHTDPMEVHDAGTVSYSKALASKDDAIEISIEVSGPEDNAEPVMAHLDDQAVRALKAMEHEKAPEDCEGKYEIDWERIHSEEGADD